MAQPKLKLYVDIVSPYAYLAFHVVRVRERLGSLFGGVASLDVSAS